MSFLARIAMRAGSLGGVAAQPLLVPKDRGIQSPPHLSRQEMQSEEGGVQTLRRQPQTESDEEELQTLRRQVEDDGEGEEAARAPMVPLTSEEEEPSVRPSATSATGTPEEEEQQVQLGRGPARMAEDGEALQVIRRMEEDGEALQVTRRMEEDEEHAHAEPLLGSAVVRRSVRRAPAAAPEKLGPGTHPASQIVSDEPVPSDLRALGAFGEPTPMPSPALPSVLIPTAYRTDRSRWGGEAPMTLLSPQPFAEAHAEPSPGHFEHPHVLIDRLDVLIHEPTPPARAPDGAKRRSRSFRARYLRRL